MPEPGYDPNPDWEYEFPIPAVNLAVTESAVTRPALVKCVGIDGRRRGSLRRFPGFRLIRDLADDISGLANIERFWYVSIQKGATPYVLRGFVVLADSTTDPAFKALYFVAYDTQDNVWRNYTLEDFAVNDRITGARVQGFWPNEFHDNPVTQNLAAAYVRDRATTYFRGQNPDAANRMMLVDITAGTITRVLLGAVNDNVTGLAYDESSSKLYGVDWNSGGGAASELVVIDLDTGAAANQGTISPNTVAVVDIAYQRTGSILWVLEQGNLGGIWQLDPITRTLSGEVALTIGGAPFNTPGAMAFDNTANKMYVISARSAFSGNAPLDVKLYEVNTTTGVCTERFNFETDFGQDGREPCGPINDQEKCALVIPDNSGVFYVLARNSELALEIDISTGPRTFDSVDVTSTWRYIYATFEAQDTRRQLNRSYYWNPDTATVEGRHASFTGPASLEGGGVTEQDGDGVIGSQKRVSGAYRLVSRTHALTSPLSAVREVTTGILNLPDDEHIRLELNRFNLPTDLALEDMDIEVYRTIGVDAGISSEDLPLVGNLYRDSFDALLDLSTDIDRAYVYGGRDGLEYNSAKSDRELSARIPYDFTLNHRGIWPRSALVLATDDQVFIVSKPFLGDDPATRTIELDEKASWRVMWSPPERYELENFRGAVTGEQYRFPDAQATIFSLERVGDFVFACTDLGVIRFHKSGSYVAVNPLAFKWGIQGRDAATSMGNRLILATAVGLIGIDGPSMQDDGFGVVQRLLSSREFWRADIASINVSYDAQLGALILFNPVQDEMFLLWPDTGAVTSLEDCPWIQGAEGVDPVLGGPPRSFWITSDGKIHTPDAEETADKKTMYGAASADTVNGTATGGSTTTLTDTSAAFASGATSFWVHFTNGANSGQSRQLTTVSTTQLTWTTPLNSGITSGDTYAVAPIPVRARGHQLPGVRGADIFKRKISISMAANINILGGEDTSANPNLRMFYRMYRHLGDTAPREASVNMVEDVGQMYAALDVQHTILFPEWVCLASDLDFEILGGRISGKISTSGSISSPQSVT